MKSAFACLVAAACVMVGGPAWACGRTKPSLSLVAYCSGDQIGGTATVTGLRPGEQVLGSVAATYPGGGFGAGPGVFIADANGTVGPITVSSTSQLTTFTATAVLDLNSNGVQDVGEPVLTKTLTNPCQGPTTPTGKAQCKRAGFQAFGFRNQGQCIKFVKSTVRH
jgi:hypothetical protein